MTCNQCGAEADGGVCLQCGPAPAETSEPAPSKSPQPQRRWLRRRRVLLGLLLLVLLPVLGGIALVLYSRAAGEKHLEAVIAQLDREDPNWRYGDIYWNRTKVPDDKNGANVVLEAARRLPDEWDHGVYALVEQEPNVRLTDAQADAIYDVLEENVEVQELARKLLKLDNGHFPDERTEQEFLAPWRLAEFLRVQSAFYAHLDRVDEACRVAQAMINTGRSCGDDPFRPVTRSHCALLACRALERALANGAASQATLLNIERMLAEEQAANLLRVVLRHERAMMHELFIALEENDESIPVSQEFEEWYLKKAQAIPGPLWLKIGWIKDHHARALEFFNEAIVLSDESPEKQRDGFGRLIDLQRQSNRYMWLSNSWISKLAALGDEEQRRRMELACARTALAVERYRLEKRQWPTSLEQLEPDFLSEIPLAPDGKPLQIRPTDDGVVVYALQSNRKEIDENTPKFRLWDVKVRRPVVKTTTFRADVDLERTVNRMYREVMGKEPPR